MKLGVLYFLTFLCLSFSYAQQKNLQPSTQRIEAFNSEQGFNQNTVSAVISDAKGYLWVGTPNGLVRYDGYNFEYFYHQLNQESIPDNQISHLLCDSKGRIWIGTAEGLCMYLTDKEEFIPISTAIKKETFIKEDSQKRIWVGSGTNVTIYNSNTSSIANVEVLADLNLTKDLKGNPITDITFISDSEFLLATAQKIYKVSINEDTSYPKISELQFDLSIGEIKKIKKINNSIWIGTNSGLYHAFYENNRLIAIGSYFNTDQGLLNTPCEIISLYKDKEKNLWVGTKQNGALKYNSKSDVFTSFKYDAKYKNGLTSNRINSFHEDDFGVIWIGTAQGGLNKLDKNQKAFQNFAHNPYDDESISSNLITDITEDNDGRIWISFFESEICKTEEILDINKGRQIRFERIKKKLNKQWVLRIYEDFKGYWWISTNKGLYLYDKKNDHLKDVKLNVNGALVVPKFNRIVDQINADQIILGGSSIYTLNNPWAAILNNHPVTINTHFFNLGKGNEVNDYAKDSHENYWFISTNGVFRFTNNNSTWSLKNHYTTNTKNSKLVLSNNRVFSIHISKTKDIWLGTFGGGIMKIRLNKEGEPQTVKSYHRKDGLRDEAIYGILEDDNGTLWISTDMGICHFNPENETFNFYDVSDGILSNNFRQSAFLKTKKGTILMGGVGGLTIFNPKEILKNEIEPKALITRLKINNHPIVSGKKFNDKVILDGSISDTEKLVIDYKNRNISLDIIVQHSATPQKNKLAYKLEGINKDWIEIDAGKATATYTNLSSGTYNFIYKGSNGDGKWTGNSNTLTIQVLAPWYGKWWSITIWALLLLLLAYGIFRYLIGFEKLNQKLKFEQLDKERAYEMNQAKLRFFTNISHDFKTPLSLIIGPLEKIAEGDKDKENQRYFSIIQNNISRLQRLIDQLISYRKAETGHLELNYTKITLGNFIYPLIEAFEDYTQRAGINFYYKVKSPNEEIVLDIDNTERILLNLFSNAIKYTELDKEVSIEAGVLTKGKSKSFFIEVSNSSKGISKDQIDKIFDRFYRGVDDNGSWRGTGIGLELCKTLTDLMNGTITVKSEVNDKTVFYLELPIDENLFEEEKGYQNKQKNIVIDWLPAEIENTQLQSPDNTLPKLLIIDDEKDVRLFLYEAFKNRYHVSLAIDGEDGLDKIKESIPQLIISDVLMPKLNGYDFCKKVKSSPEFCHIPIILLTAMDDKAKKIKGYEFGADDYIIKPFSIQHLEVRVDKLIENKQRVFDYFSRNSFLPKDSLINSIRDKEFLEKINISIEKNMANSAFGVEELATDNNMSTSHFYRRLKELTGQAPNVYLRNFRLQKAAELLTANSNLTAADVMCEIGIESKSYYSSAFKKIHGLSPSEFVKKL